jgi:hypothetical protein
LRAYVSARCKFIFAFDETHFAGVRFVMTNTGLTPAHNLIHHTGIIIAPYPPSPGYVLPPLATDRSNPIVLFPREQMDARTNASRCFTKAEIADIISGKSRIDVYGKIFYEDIFHKENRKIRFANSVEVDSDTISKIASLYGPTDLELTFWTAPVGNAAT